MTGVWICFAVILAFATTWILGKKLIPYLRKLKFGQTILDIGPSWHQNKQGTPTMGGIMFIVGMILAVVIVLPIYYLFVGANNTRFVETPLMVSKIILGLLMALCYGAVGFLDDYIKVVKKRNLGLKARQKLILQFSIAIGYLFLIYFSEHIWGATNLMSTVIPFLGRVNLGVFYLPISSILIVGMVNAVNLTDGIDGLNTSLTFFAGIFFMLIAGFFNMIGLSIVTGAVIGGCLGFLMWNIYPAKVFMGDTGSLFLGGIICALAFSLDMPIILILIGAVYIIEMLSVMLQVIYFKLTHGKRLFKMSPIHHHFEMCGWSEFKICTVFCGAMIFFGFLAVILVISGL
ncbi:MAG: Phospho-N-acetylmuramoyl-pentapeptide-transferase [Eubacteriales bacterium SKADARSKE-1]|nr:Phospho-N-acetylmuramoyl-pentapeptide-transferase [Eubacteriales bacterium SKADARSKE-1]